MAKKKTSRKKAKKKYTPKKPPLPRQAPAPAAALKTIPNIPQSNVGNVVQTEIDFNGATRLSVYQTSPGIFTVDVLG